MVKPNVKVKPKMEFKNIRKKVSDLGIFNLKSLKKG
ncbi:hypothetical protein CLV81_2978 [Flagellimonas meridianipacifica]|uniref:Uncharacterized protein n=1 Tax=Flagellimonas meridianipacifica TaxID=1080225 RepID=A0A2T0MAP7_9FLAO|nr:hypothetical protein CLV81_2978 [Allomuricauda pacifica]